MKKLFIILSIFLLPLGIKGQTPFKQEFAVGASFGMGVSSVSFSPVKIETKQLLGSHFGITGRWITQKNLGIIVEINYAQQGWDEKFEKPVNPETPDPGYKFTRRINFIEMPFMTHLYVGSKRFRFFLNIGPQIGYVISESISENISGVENLPSPNNEDRYTLLRKKPIDKKFAWGICGGPGIEIRTGIGHFQLEGRYYYGLGDLFNSNVGEPFPKSSSQVIFGKLTYLLPILKK